MGLTRAVSAGTPCAFLAFNGGKELKLVCQSWISVGHAHENVDETLRQAFLVRARSI